MAAPTNAEQLNLELINRARFDPLGEAARYGIDLNQGLAPNTISLSPKQPLAFNTLLIDSARAHSQWMIDNDIFEHEGAPTGNPPHASSPTERMQASGYIFTGFSFSGENISVRGQFSTPDPVTEIPLHHESLFKSSGHRSNIEGAAYRELGVGQIIGQFVFTPGGQAFNSSMVTQNFALTSSRGAFVTGVVYNDTDANNFYTPGEGLGGVNVTVGGIAPISTFSSGGYGVANAFAGGDNVLVGFQGPGINGTASVRVQSNPNSNSTIGLNNVKVDLVSNDLVLSSTSTELVSVATRLTLLGDARNGTGNAAANIIVGNSVDNDINGGSGSDILGGGPGNDTLRDGGTDAASVRDVMYGGAGNDTYHVTSTLTSALDIVDEGEGNSTLPGLASDGDTIISHGEFFWDFYSAAERLEIAPDANVAFLGGTHIIGGKNTNSAIFGNDGVNLISAYGGSHVVDAGGGTDAISFSLYGLAASFDGVNTLVMRPGTGIDYLYDFTSNVDKVDLRPFNFGISGQAVLDQAVNVDPNGAPNSGDEYCYFFLTNAGGVNNFVTFVGLTSGQLHAGDFITV